MNLICQNLKFLRQQTTEATAAKLAIYGIFAGEIEKHEADPLNCTDEILGRYCAFYNTTGFTSTVWKFLDAEYLQSHDLAEEWKFHQEHSAYGNRPMKRERR